MTRTPPLTLNAWLRFDAIRRGLREVPGGSEVLEIGAGQGAFGARLARRYDYLGVELDEIAGQLAATRIEAAGGRLLLGDALPLTEGRRFAAVCAFEVLEHLADDRDALAQWVARLVPGGHLVLSVPSGSHRMGPWDAAVGHYRRYDRDHLVRLLRGVGLVDVRVTGHGFPLGYVLEAVRNRLADRAAKRTAGTPEERTAGSGRSLQPLGFGSMTWLLTLPFRVLQVPFRHSRLGTGLVAVGRLPLRD
ncbi:MAG: class I SAM-dependent methyltransferase [Nitriliruptor sp.]|nr:MAG: class I SAM-dependent methyltransferase [Nitriliruptor sp.]